MRIIRHRCYQPWEGHLYNSLNVGRVEDKCRLCYGWVRSCIGKREGPRFYPTSRIGLPGLEVGEIWPDYEKRLPRDTEGGI